MSWWICSRLFQGRMLGLRLGCVELDGPHSWATGGDELLRALSKFHSRKCEQGSRGQALIGQREGDHGPFPWGD